MEIGSVVSPVLRSSRLYTYSAIYKLKSNHITTVPYQKYSYPTKYPCSDCAIYRLNIHKWKLLEDDLKRYISLQNYDSDFVKQISDYKIVFIYGYATCATIGRSGAN